MTTMSIFTTYGTLRRDAPFFKEKMFDYVILDEAQAIKNASTESAKAARLLRGQHRLALSGTPIENHLGELWSLFEFLNPGMLGSASFSSWARGSMSKLDEAQRALLAQALRPFHPPAHQGAGGAGSSRQSGTDPVLPARSRRSARSTTNCAITTGAPSSTASKRDGIEKSKIHILEALLRLRQAAIHPGLIDRTRAGEPSAKMDMLLPQLVEVLDEGHKALVFSQFTSMLGILREQAGQRKYPLRISGRPDAGPGIARSNGSRTIRTPGSS